MRTTPRTSLRCGTVLAGLSLLLAAGMPLRSQTDPTPVRGSKVVDYTVKAENQADGSILVTYELKAQPKVSTVVKQGRAFSQFDLGGFVTGGAKGFPETLSKQVNLMVDPSREYAVDLVEATSKVFGLEHPYLPSRGTILRSQDPSKVPFEISPESLKGGTFPAQVLEHGETFFIRNVSGYHLRFAVNQVDVRNQTARLYTKLVFKVTPQGSRAGFSFANAADRKVAPEVYGVVKSMFLNAPATTQTAAAGTRATWPYEVGDKGEILVIYTSRDAAAIQPYIDHKRGRGWVVNTQQVATGTNVKTTIANAYAANKNILYVQLVGDWADLKCDTTTTSAGTTETAAIDNALGLVSGTDKYFDLIIGRFSAESAAQVTTQVDKAIAYENAGATAWKMKGLGMASNEGAGQGDDGESDIQHENIIKTNKLMAKGYTAVATAYDSPSTAPLSACTSPVNAGLGVINYTGHGIHYGWATTGMNITAVNSLTNGAMQPIIFSVACVVGQYNTQTCFAEAWLRKVNGGAVAAVMSTIYQPWLPPMKGQDYMNDLLTGGYNYTANPGDGTNSDHGKSTVGSIAMNAFNLMLGESQDSDSVQTTQSWIVFGDAALEVAPSTTNPTAPVITTQPAPQTVTVGQTATFTVVASGTAPLTYKWMKNGAVISGATAASYTTPATTTTDNGANFTVTVSNTAGSVTSNAAKLTVNPASALTISTQPANLTVNAGATASFNVVVSGGKAPYTYQWYKNGAVVTGATAATYSFTAATGDNLAKYKVVVKDSATPQATLTSSEATLTVNPVTGTDKIVNGGFESGTTSWAGTTGVIGNWNISPYYQPAFEGVNAAFLGGNGKTTTETLYQTVSLPSTATSATLSFYLHIDTKETGTTVYDKLAVQVRNSSGTVLKTLATYSNANAASGYQVRTFDVSAYKGQTIRVHFNMTEDAALATNFLVDKVSLIVK